MQQLWQELNTLALVGTGNTNKPLPTLSNNSGEALATSDSSDREGHLLSIVATLSLYNRRGALPPLYSKPLPEPAVPEKKAVCSPDAAEWLVKILQRFTPETLPEWLGITAKSNLFVPPDLLPALLSKSRAFRYDDTIEQVIGERGRWLADYNSEWDFAKNVTNFEDCWQTNRQSLRLRTLKLLRRADPAKARNLLESTWHEEKTEDRVTFLRILKINLSQDDEPFLERIVDDKDFQVHYVVMDLLCRISNSQLVQNMIARTENLLTWQQKAKSKKGSLEVILPEEYDATMEHYKITRYPRSGMTISQQAYWLQQMLDYVPPNFWLEKFNLTAHELVKAISKNAEWHKVLFSSLAIAAAHFDDAQMAEALLTLAFKDVSKQCYFLVNLLSHTQKERLLREALEAKTSLRNDLVHNLVIHHEDWGVELGRVFLQYIPEYISADTLSKNFDAKTVFKRAAQHLPPVLIEEARGIWPTEAKMWPNWSDSVKWFMDLLQFRADMHKAFGIETEK